MARKANLVVDQGSTFTTTITLTDDDGTILNLTGYTGAGQIRKWYTSTNAVSFSVAIAPTSGEVTLQLSATTTANMAAGRYVYDVELTTGSTVSRVLEGLITVTPEVTKV